MRAKQERQLESHKNKGCRNTRAVQRIDTRTIAVVIPSSPLSMLLVSPIVSSVVSFGAKLSSSSLPVVAAAAATVPTPTQTSSFLSSCPLSRCRIGCDSISVSVGEYDSGLMVVVGKVDS